MIQGMTRPGTTKLSVISLAVSLAGILSEPAPLIARATTHPSPADQSTPELFVRVYSFPELSPWILQQAETEAANILRRASIGLRWVDCTSHLPSASCTAAVSPAEPIVRFLAKALPQADPSALGIAGSSGESPVAFIFYDRIAAKRSHSRLMPVMLGRVVAHEITHLLLPEEDHSRLGLMRGQWGDEDLLITSSTSLGLPVPSLLLMQKEALRRATIRSATAAK